MPDVSVIIPTHNRSRLLREHLGALSRQDYPRARVEWIVVCDGCRDDSVAVAGAMGADRVIELEGRGAAAARNAGLRAAGAPLAAFLDDDILATPGWLAALVDDAAEGKGKRLSMGYCPFAAAALRGGLDRRNAAWYEGKVRPLADPDHVWRFTDFFGGNFAADRAALLALGAFDDRFALFEDAELAWRALDAGWSMGFVPKARAEHHAHRDLRDYGRQAFRSGQADVLFSRVHPGARASLRLGHQRPIGRRAVGRLWRAITSRGSFGILTVEAAARLGDRLNLPRPVDIFCSLLWDAQYWRGVASA